MKNKDYRYAKLRKKLQRYKEYGKKKLIWKLSYSQIEIIEDLGYRVEPYLYQITTRSFFNIRGIKSNLIKEVHYKNKDKKHTYIRKLNKDEEQLLKDFGVRYHAVKYVIHLV